MWVEDGSGRRTGWLPGEEKRSDIPSAAIDVLLPTDPDADADLMEAQNWPYVVVVDNPAADLRVFVEGVEDGTRLDFLRFGQGNALAIAQTSAGPWKPSTVGSTRGASGGEHPFHPVPAAGGPT